MFSRLSPVAWILGYCVWMGSAHAQLELSGPDQVVPPPPTATAEIDETTSDLPEGAEVMVTGPLHEAFAEQFTSQPEPGIIITKKPPEPIDEIPPEYRPDGQDIVWIPGYWGWDPEREDFLWITGIWRQAPPDRNWVPGYWAEVPEGYQWIAGFWAMSDAQEIRYLPPPPEQLAAEPSTPAPSQDHFWIPGQWSYVNNNYQWRAGYWTMGYPDWVWVPDRYVWTPMGCIYRPGYWDYMVAERGTVFCPVYWSQPVGTYQFRPTYVVSTGPTLLANLFVYPRYNHYFFGNYYSSRFLNQSIYPWVTYGQQSRRYDPLYGYYRTQYRDADYLNRLVRLHNYYAANVNYQPPRTLNAQRDHQHDWQDRQDLAFHATQLNQLARNNIGQHDDFHHHMNIVRLADNERQQIQSGLAPARQVWKQRAEAEAKNRPERNDDNRDGRGKQPGGRGDGQDRHWNLPTAQAGGKLGSIAIGQTGSPDRGANDRNGSRDRDDNRRDDNRTVNGDSNKSRGGQDPTGKDQPGNANRNMNRDTNRDGIVDGREPRNQDGRNQDARDKNIGDGQKRDGLGRDTLSRDGLSRDGLNRDSTNRETPNRDGVNRNPLNRDPLNRDSVNRDPKTNLPNLDRNEPRNGSQPRDRQPNTPPGSERRNPLDGRILPGVNPGVNPGLNPGVTPVTPNQPGAADRGRGSNKAPSENRNPLPGRTGGRDTIAPLPGRNPSATPNPPVKTPVDLPPNFPKATQGIPNPPGNPGLNNKLGSGNSNAGGSGRTQRVNPTTPSIAPGEPNPSSTRRAGGAAGIPGNIQNDIQKMREVNQRRPEAPRRAPQAPRAEKKEKDK